MFIAKHRFVNARSLLGTACTFYNVEQNRTKTGGGVIRMFLNSGRNDASCCKASTNRTHKKKNSIVQRQRTEVIRFGETFDQHGNTCTHRLVETLHRGKSIKSRKRNTHMQVGKDIKYSSDTDMEPSQLQRYVADRREKRTLSCQYFRNMFFWRVFNKTKRNKS